MCQILWTWACATASGNESRVFIGDALADRSSRMSPEVYGAIVSAQIHSNDDG